MARSPPTREAQLARSVLTRNLEVKAGENVIVEGWSHTLPWAVALVREARRLGAHPILLYEDEAAFWDSVDAKEDEVLGAAPTHEWAALAKTNVYIHLWNVGDRIRMDALPPKRVAKLFGFNDKWYDAAHSAKLRGTRLDIGRPFPNLAEAYGIDLATWTQQVFEGAVVDPAELEKRGEPIAKALERGRTVRIHDEAGTDLTLRLSGGEAVRDFGRVTRADRASRFRILNFLPAGAVRIALDPRVADGTIRANRASF
ncbi:peptidase M29, aminopeptidase II, partial [mine drainage metagenome]